MKLCSTCSSCSCHTDDASDQTRVIIESPFAAKDDADIARNIDYARAALRDSLLRGEAPYASHLLYTQPGVLDDRDTAQRKMGMLAGFAWGRVATSSVVYVDRGVSVGMKAGIARAESEGRKVVERSLIRTSR